MFDVTSSQLTMGEKVVKKICTAISKMAYAAEVREKKREETKTEYLHGVITGICVRGKGFHNIETPFPMELTIETDDGTVIRIAAKPRDGKWAVSACGDHVSIIRREYRGEVEWQWAAYPRPYEKTPIIIDVKYE